MITSFRLRLALLSALLSGLALAAFGLGTWWLIRDIKIDHIDAEVRAHAEREAHRQRDAAGWRRTVANILAGFGSRDASRLLMLVEDGGGAILYRSPHWPAALDPAALPWPKAGTGEQRGASNPSPISPAQAAEAPLAEGLEPHRPPWERAPPPWHGGPPGEGEGPEGQPPRHPPPGPWPEGSDPPPRPAPLGPPPATALHAAAVAGRHWRFGLAVTERVRIAVAVDAGIVDGDLRAIRNAFLAVLPFALLLIGLGSWAFAARALRPLRKLTADAAKVTAAGLDRRLASAGEDREFVELIEVYNHMLERLERSFQQAHRFSADAAHELKTPLAILQGQLERAIQAAEEGSPMQSQLSGILDEVRRLSTISRKLLLLSQADAGRLALHRVRFDLSATLADLLEDSRMLAPQLRMEGKIPPDLTVSADAGLLPQVLHNLISNAIKYNLPQGWIRIGAARTAQGVEVRVANASPGISPAERERIFERFFRADPARNRHVEGVGLGLSVAREIARAHGGDLTLETPGEDAVCFVLRLPE